MAANSTASVTGSIVSELAVLRGEGCCPVTGAAGRSQASGGVGRARQRCLKVAETPGGTSSFWAGQARVRFRPVKTAAGPSDVIGPDRPASAQ